MSFLGAKTETGEVTKQRIQFAEFLDGTPVSLPVATVGGASDGPTLYVQAGLHGDEATGIEICRIFLNEVVPGQVRGRVVAVPVANVPAHLGRTRGFLHEERWMLDVNRIFPGSEAGLLSERIAHVLFHEFLGHADFSVDLHSALDGCVIAPFIYITPDDNKNQTLEMRERLGTAFGTPYLYRRPRDSRLGTSDVSRSISAQADEHSIPMITAEMGESRRVTAEYVPLGVQGLFNVMKAMDMLDGEAQPPSQQRTFNDITLIHANRGGGLRLNVGIGDVVGKGQEIGDVVDVFGEPIETLTSPVEGFVLRKMLLGSIGTGAEVAWIGH